MFPEQFKKILNLVKNTGDRVIIFNPNAPDDSYVVMDFDNYALMAAKAIKEISTTKNPVKESLSEGNSLNFPQNDKSENLTEEDLTDKINREISMWKNRDNSAFPEEENKPKKAWQIPPQVKDKAQEVE